MEDLQKKREELRKELLKIEAQIVEEEASARLRVRCRKKQNPGFGGRREGDLWLVVISFFLEGLEPPKSFFVCLGGGGLEPQKPKRGGGVQRSLVVLVCICNPWVPSKKDAAVYEPWSRIGGWEVQSGVVLHLPSKEPAVQTFNPIQSTNQGIPDALQNSMASFSVQTPKTSCGKSRRGRFGPQPGLVTVSGASAAECPAPQAQLLAAEGRV